MKNTPQTNYNLMFQYYENNELNLYFLAFLAELDNFKPFTIAPNKV